MCQWHEGCRSLAEQVDHITPIALGGAWWQWSNLQSLCLTHHEAKTKLDMIAMREREGRSDHGAPMARHLPR